MNIYSCNVYVFSRLIIVIFYEFQIVPNKLFFFLTGIWLEGGGVLLPAKVEMAHGMCRGWLVDEWTCHRID